MRERGGERERERGREREREREPSDEYDNIQTLPGHLICVLPVIALFTRMWSF